jgi:uncharacterized protein DUF6627
MVRYFRRALCCALIASITGLGLPLPASAGLIRPDAAPGAERAYLNAVLDRAEVRAQLEANGVAPADVKARVAALSDAEAADLANRIASLPAGGDGGVGALIGALLIVFLVLLITDILGFTKVFPFTKPIQK